MISPLSRAFSRWNRIERRINHVIATFEDQRGSVIKATNSLTARTKYPRHNNYTLTGVGSSCASLVNTSQLIVHRADGVDPLRYNCGDRIRSIFACTIVPLFIMWRKLWRGIEKGCIHANAFNAKQISSTNSVSPACSLWGLKEFFSN